MSVRCAKHVAVIKITRVSGFIYLALILLEHNVICNFKKVVRATFAVKEY
jgi:hypothetical protein